MVCMHVGARLVCMHNNGGCVSANGVGIIMGVVCLQMEWYICTVRLVRHLLWCCSFMSGHGLTLRAAVVGTAESVSSYLLLLLL